MVMGQLCRGQLDRSRRLGHRKPSANGGRRWPLAQRVSERGGHNRLMNPVSPSLLAVVAIVLLLAFVGGLGLGLALARSRTRAAVDAALAQSGHAAQLELAQARERLHASAQAVAAVQADLERARAETHAVRHDLDASRAQVLRAAASEAQKHQLVASLDDRVAALERDLARCCRPGRLRAKELQAVHAELAQVRTRR